MKLRPTTSLFTVFLLSAAITTSHLSSAAADLIRDIEGKPLLNGASYYIVSAIWGGGGGGVTLGKTGNETCPVSVVQEASDRADGKPVRISSPYRILYIYEGLILNLAFTSVPDCANTPSKWTVVRSGDKGFPVKLSGEYDDTLDGWFHIERSGMIAYKIKFCASGDDTCKDISVRVDENRVRQLVATEENRPFLVQFRRAGGHHDASADI